MEENKNYLVFFIILESEIKKFIFIEFKVVIRVGLRIFCMIRSSVI